MRERESVWEKDIKREIEREIKREREEERDREREREKKRERKWRETERELRWHSGGLGSSANGFSADHKIWIFAL